jgi:hypothetical protein
MFVRLRAFAWILAIVGGGVPAEAQEGGPTVTAADSIGIPEQQPDLVEQQELHDQLRLQRNLGTRTTYRSATPSGSDSEGTPAPEHGDFSGENER